MKGVGELVAEGTYPVVLTRASEKKTQAGNDMVTLIATIKDSDTDFDGRTLARNFVINNATDADNSGTLYYMQQAFLAFGADEEDVTSENFNPVEVAKSLYGSSAEAVVTHNIDKNDPEKKYVNAVFQEPSF